MPPKAARRRLESDPGLDFDLQLAERLKKTLTEIHAMSHDEWILWVAFFKRKAQEEELERLKAGA